MKRKLRIFQRELFDQNNELRLSSRIILFFLAGIIDAIVMCFIEPPNADDVPAVFVVAIMIGFAGCIVFLPISALLRRYLSNHQPLWPSIATYIILCAFYSLFISSEGTEIYAAMLWVETLAFLHIPVIAYITLESILYTLSLQPHRQSDILDDL